MRTMMVVTLVPLLGLGAAVIAPNAGCFGGCYSEHELVSITVTPETSCISTTIDVARFNECDYFSFSIANGCSQQLRLKLGGLPGTMRGGDGQIDPGAAQSFSFHGQLEKISATLGDEEIEFVFDILFLGES